MSKKKKLRSKMMAYASGNPRAFAQAKARAARERARLNLCPHGDTERVYKSQEEVDNDQTPAHLCGTCGKPKLIVAIISRGATMGRAEAAAISGFLR